MTRVLVVDDQILIRAGLAALLRAAPGLEVVGEAVDGEHAELLAGEHRPDVILMDVRMPGAGGISATERILAAGIEPLPRIIILTTFDLDEYVFDALRAGAHAFLLKDTPPDRLLAAVSRVAAGEMLFAPSVIRRLVEAYAPQPQLAAELDVLTARECEVLALVGKGMSNADIATHLFVTQATVKTHLNRTMTKLGLASRAQAVVVAYETGLVAPKRSGLTPTQTAARRRPRV